MSIFDYWFVTILNVQFAFDFKNLVAFRLFRMAKLLRLIRLVRLFSDLYLLFEGLKDGVRLLLWATVLLVVVVYIGAIVLLEISKVSDMKDDEYVQIYWATLPRTMLTLFEITTYSDWTQHVRRFAIDELGGADGYNLGTFFVFYIAITSIGLMNIVSGTMITGALEVTRQDLIFRRNCAQASLLRKLNKTKEFVPAILTHDKIQECEEHIMTAGFSKFDIYETVRTMRCAGVTTFTRDEFFEGLILCFF